MSLAQQLEDDLKSAMRAGETRRRDVIRFLRAAIKNAAIEKRADLDDAEILQVIRQQMKQRRDSIEMFRSGGRANLADEEEAQIAVLQAYLPAQLSDEEARDLVRRVAASLGATSQRDMGRLMPALVSAAEGRVENRTLSQFARDELARRVDA